jgi:hypothetical protein
VEQTNTASGGQPSPPATNPHMVSASASPRSPVAALALPLDSTTAAARPPVAARCLRLTTTGAAATRFWVKTPAAATVASPAATTNDRSSSPDALMPHATPAAVNPSGATTLIGSPSARR